MMTNHLTLTLFGEFSLTAADKKAVSISGDRPITLLAFLLLHRHTPVSRQHLAYTLWPDSTDTQARANLGNLLFTLRQTLPHADEFVAADSMTLQWRTDACYTLDVAEFEAALAAATTAVSPADKKAYLETAVALYKGDLLPGNYDDWIIPLRETLRQSHQDTLYQLVALLEQEQDFRAASRFGQRLIQQDPLDETAYVQQMRLLAYSGDRAGVRRIFALCVATLRRELDVEPSSATIAAYEQVLRLEAPVPAVATRPAAPHQTAFQPRPLPIPATPFIGRGGELTQLAGLFADPACRLINIVGQGGMGKTRLALAAASAHQSHFADGVAFVPLAAITAGFQFVSAIGGALNFPFSGHGKPLTQLFHYLKDKKMLLVLDNLEQLLPEIDILHELLETANGLVLMVTSRERLNLHQEWLFPLGGLPVPPEDIQILGDDASIRLFLNSARQHRPDLVPDEKDLQAIRNICELVGGTPLGIELAASWVRLLTCPEIAQEFEKGLDFLSVSVRNMPLRHHSLRAVFDYSWNLLTLEDQQVLLRLAIFRGGFTREAAGQVAGANLQQLLALIDHSLVQVTGPGRYNLHSIVHQFAGQHLLANPNTQQATAQQHSRYYLQWLVDMESALSSAGQREALRAITPELANLRAAWQTALQIQEFSLLQCASFPLFYFYELRGLVQEGETVFRQSADQLAQADSATDVEAQLAIASFRTNQGYFLFRLGQNNAAEELLRREVTQLQTMGDETVLPFSLRYLGLVTLTNGYYEEAQQLMQQSLTLTRHNQKQWEMAITQAYSGLIAYHQGYLETALNHLEVALEDSREMADNRLTAYSLLLLGRAYLAQGQVCLAEEAFEKSMVLAQQTDDIFTINTVQLYLGMVKQAQGDLGAARELFQESIAAYLKHKDLVGAKRAQISLGFLEVTAGNLRTAQELFQSILDSKEVNVGKKYVHAAMLGLAAIHAGNGDRAAAQHFIDSILKEPVLDRETEHQARRMHAQLADHHTLLPSTIDMIGNVNYHNVPVPA